MKVTFEGPISEIENEMREWLGMTPAPVSEHVIDQTDVTPAPVDPVDPVDDTVALDEVPLPPENTPELDANGDAWDENIHASTKTKTAKGVWKKRKGGPKDPETTESLTTPPPGPPVRDFPKEIMAECSRLLNDGQDLPKITKEGLLVAGIADQADVWKPETPASSLEKYLEHLKSI